MQYYEDMFLYHHGIKGMKWGVRRFQKKDGSLTPAGRKRYDDTEEGQRLKSEIKRTKAAYKKANSELTKESNKGLLANSKKLDQLSKDLEDSKVDYDRSKLNYKTGKEADRIKNKGIEIKNKSKHRLKLEQQYKDLGMTDEQAQAAANNKIRTEKILAATAGLTVAAAAAYAYNEHRKTKIDGIIKAGENLQRIEMRDTNGKLNDVFYASKGSHDNKRYAAMLGKTRQQQTGEAYMMKIQAGKDVKVASQENARKIFGDLWKNDSEFRSAVKNSVDTNPHDLGQGIANKVKAKIKGGSSISTEPSARQMKQMYDNFNTNLVFLNQSDSKNVNKFYDALKKQGYGAIQDVNDIKNSGYGAKNPLIIFDNAAQNLKVTSSTKMADVSPKDFLVESGKATVEMMIKQYAIPGAGAVAGAAALNYSRNETKKYNTAATNKFVKDYKKKHPNTNLSYAEIAELQKKSK